MARIDRVRSLVRRGFTEEQANDTIDAFPDGGKFTEMLDYAYDHFKAPSENPYYIECRCMNPVFKSRISSGIVLLEDRGAIGPSERDIMLEEIDRIPVCPHPKRGVEPGVAEYVEDHFGR